MHSAKSYRDLEIYQESKKLAIEIHKMTLKLPRFETYEEGSQIRRSSKAVTTMIVEGYGRRRYKADLIKHLVIAHTECDETKLHLDFLFETESLKDESLYNTITQANEILSKKIYRFMLWVEKNWE
jgi:four helix bundle protein